MSNQPDLSDAVGQPVEASTLQPEAGVSQDSQVAQTAATVYTSEPTHFQLVQESALNASLWQYPDTGPSLRSRSSTATRSLPWAETRLQTWENGWVIVETQHASTDE